VSDFRDLKKQMTAEVARSNFSGAGSKWTAD
jgi:hypothetical protein